MSGNKVFAKRKNREQKLREKKQHHDRQAGLPPRFVFHENGVSASFVRLIKDAIDRIDVRSFSPQEREYVRKSKNQTWFEATCYLANTGDSGCSWMLSLWERKVFASILPEVVRYWMPFRSVVFQQKRANAVDVYFYELKEEKVNGKWLFYSKNNHQVEFGGQKRTIAWSRHAIERLRDRIADQCDYEGLRRLFFILDTCVTYPLGQLPGGQPCFEIFQPCWYDPPSHDLCHLLTGNRPYDHKGGKAYLRLGYCPAVLEGERFLKATTVLCPGFRGTPEHLALSRLPVTDPNRHRMLSASQSPSLLTLARDEIDTLVWQQRYGVPQVIWSDRYFYEEKLGVPLLKFNRDRPFRIESPAS